MDLENIAISLRPRTAWEATDLGILITRQWWKVIALPWALSFIPLVLLLPLLLPNHPLWALFIVWLLLPLFSRIPLSLFSRCLFNDVPDTATALKQIPRLLFKNLSLNPLRRFNINRTFSAPVYLLEQQSSQQARRRVNQLQYRISNVTSSMTLLYFIVQLLFAAMLILLPYMLLPDDTVTAEWLGSIMAGENNQAGFWILYYCWCISVLFVEPFHIASGFALYLSNRTRLEAWDIELIFRKLARRSSHLLLLGIFIVMPDQATAEEPAPRPEVASQHYQESDIKPAINSITKQPPFRKIVSEDYWKYVGESGDEGEEWEWNWDFLFDPEQLDTLNLVAELMRMLIWIALGVGLIILYRKRDLWWHLVWPSESKTSNMIPDSIAGMDVRPESLPDDIVSAAQALWQQGQSRDAIGLLYRGALSHLLTHDKLALKNSDTESECARQVKQQQPEKSLAFTHLTLLWQAVAWAHHNVKQEQFNDTLVQWEQHFKHSKDAVTS